METKDLEAGDTFYHIVGYSISCYRYLCVHPMHKNYHILIDKSTEEPLRLHCDRLEAILLHSFSTFYDARLSLADALYARATRIRTSTLMENKQI